MGDFNIDINWDNIDLGKRIDSEIAKELGISYSRVNKERNKRNILPFKGMLLTQEGESCRSLCEAMYDAYLHENNIEHDHEVKIGSMVADFKIGNEYHEVAGMIGYYRYDERHKEKKELYKNLGVKVIWLTSEDVEKLFKTCKTKIISNPNRICKDCDKNIYDLVKRVCRNCYMKQWHKGESNSICKKCHGEFYSDNSGKFCSFECYSESIKKMDYEKIFHEVETSGKSIRQVAISNNINPSTLYLALRRAKNKAKGLTGNGAKRKR